MLSDDALRERWDELGSMERTELRIAWREAFGSAAPNFLSMTFMRKALIYNEQRKGYGGLSTDLKRALHSAATGKQGGGSATAIRPGTQLIREWNGRQYRVEVTDDGFRMNNEQFRSLSAIALRITGTHWSGPRFFGLNAKTGATS